MWVLMMLVVVVVVGRGHGRARGPIIASDKFMSMCHETCDMSMSMLHEHVA